MTVSLRPVRTPRRRRRKRLLHDALQPSRRERLLGNAMLSFRAGVWLTLIDPKPSETILRTGRRNRVMPPFKLPQCGISTFADWMPARECKDGALPSQIGV